MTGLVPSEGPFLFEDDFERRNASALGGDWQDCNKLSPGNYEPLGVLNGSLALADPMSRDGTYHIKRPIQHPPPGDELFVGIGCAAIETGADRVSVSVVWSGNVGVLGEPPIRHVEATPLLYIVPSHERMGFGAWPSQLYGATVIIAGYIGQPPEKFDPLAVAVLSGHKTGESITLELRAETPGLVTVWVDGTQMSFNGGYGTEPFVVDPGLTGSTLHGVAVDAHYVNPPELGSTIGAAESIVIKEIVSLSP